jgi:hypothetical protein
LEIPLTVVVVVEKQASAGALRRDVVNAPGEFDAQLSWHVVTSPATVWIRPMAQKGLSL